MRTSQQVAWPLPLDASPTEVARALRHRDRLVALIGDWAGGGALITSDPAVRATSLDEIDTPPGPTRADSVLAPDGFVGPSWFGVFGYQLGRQFEELPPAPLPTGTGPTVDVAFYPTVLRFDRQTTTWWFESEVTEANEIENLERTRDAILADLAVASARSSRTYELADFAVTPTLNEHRSAVERIIEHIHAGDIFQANVCLRLDSTIHGDPLDLFTAGVEKLAPAYAAYVRTDAGAVASLSPELFLERHGHSVRTAPIKGTAPRTTDPDELRSSAKNRAENVMIVDLMRNDLGRVSEPPSVTVPDIWSVQPHAGVWHLVSEVQAQMRPGVSDAELIRRTFPPGSVTGAPKVRAMELINEVEATARHAYTGAIGWATPSGLELNVAIRTFEFEGSRVWLGVGGGIVAGSCPESEVAECFVKAAPLLSAVGGRLRPELATEVVNLDDSGASTLGHKTSRRSDLVPARTAVPPGDVYAAGGGEARGGEQPTVRVAVYDDQVVLDPSCWPASQASLEELDRRLARAGIRSRRRVSGNQDTVQASEVFDWNCDGTQEVLGSPASSMRSWLSQPAVPPPTRTDRGGGTPRPSVLVVDNYDSFVFNLARYCETRGASVEVVRNDRIRVVDVTQALRAGDFDRVLLSPGPGGPADAGICVELVRGLPDGTPLLGVCLGHQAIAEAFGAAVIRAPEAVHGQDAIVYHDSAGLFHGLNDPLTVGRYHSLVVEDHSLGPTCLTVSARTPTGLVMGIRHRTLPVEGVQFHPESVLTPRGGALIANFLRLPSPLARGSQQLDRPSAGAGRMIGL